MTRLVCILLILPLVSLARLPGASGQSFVGSLTVTPDRGPVGTKVTLSSLKPTVFRIFWTSSLTSLKRFSL